VTTPADELKDGPCHHACLIRGREGGGVRRVDGAWRRPRGRSGWPAGQRSGGISTTMPSGRRSNACSTMTCALRGARPKPPNGGWVAKRPGDAVRRASDNWPQASGRSGPVRGSRTPPSVGGGAHTVIDADRLGLHELRHATRPQPGHFTTGTLLSSNDQRSGSLGLWSPCTHDRCV
jgi:hypothetical protein